MNNNCFSGLRFEVAVFRGEQCCCFLHDKMHGCGAKYLEELKKSYGKEWQPVNGYGYWENRAWQRFAYIISQLRNGVLHLLISAEIKLQM
ncbi:hypothetical protein T12_12030 [Trichinella patagoniensis]|uniref:Uncharacterized protein n=1 Tax=Trichinella patagoniensis TaxID=990121 RepID=A0A0V1A8Y1_9BILA|nr:hypothetical protein T12_12030 [Trichinella patagoniensis]